MKMKYCKKCMIYTLKDVCKKCGEASTNPRPARFSPKDPYGKYRRKLKLEFA
ncbi:MAG: RNA-protein complex protein Nop10 [Candidatus Hydrothermarchaeaceae archaeon]